MPVIASRHEPVVEVIHGETVVDPYRWLEDRNSLETQEWIDEQKVRHDAYFAGLPEMETLRGRVRELLDVETVEQPAQVGERYFFRRRRKGHEQACIWTQEVVGREERVLVDPSGQGPFTAVLIHRISEDGRLLAYSLKRGGERMEEIHFVDVETGRILEDDLPAGVGRGIAFTSDLSGFYYCHESPAGAQENQPHEIRYHRFGNRIDGDERLISFGRTPRSRLVLTSDSTRLGAIFAHDCGSEIRIDFHLAPRSDDRMWKAVFADRMPPYGPFFHNGRIYASSYIDDPNGQIVELEEDGSETAVIVPPWKSEIRNLRLAGDRIYVLYKIDLATVIRCWTLTGEFVGELPEQLEGSFGLLPAYTNSSEVLLFSHESFTQRPSVFIYNAAGHAYEPWRVASKTSRECPCSVKRVAYRSKDQTLIPMWLVASDRGEQYRSRPAILTAYGAAGMSMTPRFSVLVAIMLELGCVFALPNIRGGGEFGREWHEAVTGRNRQIVYDDFLAAAEWLCANGITESERLAIFGGSNSGLLVGVAMTQRPELFRAVLCLAPILDMVRYEKFGDARKWVSEHGTVNDADDFRALYAYSPYHRVIEEQNYPATMFVTGDKDAQCDAAHVRKMAARLQDREVQSRPVLVDYTSERGHSAVLPLSVRIDALTRRITFLCNELGISLPQETAYDSALL